jgi:cyanate permease
LTAYIATHFGWNRALDFAALVTIASAACWIFVDAGQSFDGKLEK